METINKLAVLDVCDTLTLKVIWYYLTTKLGWSWEEHSELWATTRQKARTFDEHFATVLHNYKKTGNANRQFIHQIMSEVVFQPHALELCNLLRQNGYKIHLLSGGFNTYVAKVAGLTNAHGFSAAASFVFDANDNLENMLVQKEEHNWKTKTFEDICKSYKIPMDEVWVLGDGANDVGVFNQTPKSIAVNITSKDIIPHATYVAKNLKEVPALMELR